jgi:hypothetical protein
MTDFAKRILTAARERCGQSQSNIVEHLVRLHGGALAPEDFGPIEDMPDAPEPVLAGAVAD